MTFAELRTVLAAAPGDARVLCFDEKSGDYLEPNDASVEMFCRAGGPL